MKGLMRFALLMLLLGGLVACSGKGTQSEDDLSLEGEQAEADIGAADSDFTDGIGESGEGENSEQAGAEDDLSLEEESGSQASENAEGSENADAAAAANESEPSLEEPPPAEPVVETPIAEPSPADQVDQALQAPPEPEPTPEPTAPSMPMDSGSGLPTITSIRYKANDNGGTILIEANGPISYTTRTNPEQKQLIVEIPNSVLPRRLQRPINTRDMRGSIGAIDPYQNSGSNIARLVIQLREGAPEPAVTQEGNTVLVMANALNQNSADMGEDTLTQGETVTNVDLNDGKILSSQSLTEYLSGNLRFYGKKISIETNENMDVRDVLRFITEESGVNMVVAEEVKGSIGLKLRQVPWDQALVVIMKAKKLGYTRSGNILRIAPIEQLQKEEEDATKLAKAKADVETLKIRMFPISYARVDDMLPRVKEFLSTRGKVVADTRTNALVVTDVEESLQRASKLIASLDTQPPQVLIEGKIVEAKEDFARTVGVNWNFSGTDIRLGTGASGPVNMRPSLSVAPSSTSGGAFNFGLNLGVLDIFGDLSATLALNEREEKVKIISSPRVVTITNEPANIKQTTEVPLQSVTQNGTSTISTFTFKPLTLELDVTPQITSDASIIMKVRVKREFRGANIGGTSEAFAVNSREANTRVLVRNGQTAVIGGIYQSDATEAEGGVPYLREIPVLGALFRGRSTTKEKSELLIFLTPRILATTEGGGGASPGTGGDL